jgi:hypothetical protein
VENNEYFIKQEIFSAKELGLNILSVAVESVRGAVNGVEKAGGGTVSLL